MSDDLVRRARNCANGVGRFKTDRGDFGLLDDLADRIEALEAAIKRQAGASRTLRAHALAEFQHLKDMDRSEYSAAKTLDSEREANAILTAQVEALTAERDALRADECDADGCAAHISAFASRVDALTAERDALSKAISHEGRRTDAAEAGLKKTTETLRYIAKQWPDTSAAKSALAAIRALGGKT